MAKFGETKQEYDPFSSISSSLSALSEPVVEDAAASPAPAEQVAEPKPVSPKKPARTAKKVEQPERVPEPAADQPAVKASSGAATASRASSESDDVDQSVALRVTKRIKINKQEAARLEMAALRLSATVGIGVDLSKITRALWEIYLTHEEEILRSLPDDAVPAKRPANHDAIGLAELDERLASMIGEGLMMASMRSRRNG